MSRNRCAEYFEKMAHKSRPTATKHQAPADAEERRRNFAGHVFTLREGWRNKGRTDQQYASHAQTPATTINRWASPETAPLKDREGKVDRFCDAQGIVTESMWEPILRYRPKGSATASTDDDSLRNEVRSKVLKYIESDTADDEGLKLLARLVTSLGGP